MSFPKKIREIVYNKFNGHCSYCGCLITLKEMQIDHANSIYHAGLKGIKIDNSLDNLMPSCRQCNFYKHESNIEKFRNKLLSTLQETSKKAFVVKLAIKYGFLQIGDWNGKFYFEKETTKHGKEKIQQ